MGAKIEKLCGLVIIVAFSIQCVQSICVVGSSPGGSQRKRNFECVENMSRPVVVMKAWRSTDEPEIPVFIHDAGGLFLLGSNDPNKGWQATPLPDNFAELNKKATANPGFGRPLFDTANAFIHVIECGDCGPNQGLLKECSEFDPSAVRMYDRECIECDPYQIIVAKSCFSCSSRDSYQNERSQTSCKTCGPGLVANIRHTGCVPCPTGTAELQHKRGLCTPCPEGQYQNQTSQTFCKMCEAGFTVNENQNGCIPCPRGYSGTNGICTKCTNNQFNNKTGAVNCLQCPNDGIIERVNGANVNCKISERVNESDFPVELISGAIGGMVLVVAITAIITFQNNKKPTF